MFSILLKKIEIYICLLFLLYYYKFDRVLTRFGLMAIYSPHRTPTGRGRRRRRRRRGDNVIASPPVTPVRPHRHVRTPRRPVRVRNHDSGILDVVRVRLGQRILSPVMNFGSPRERARDLAPVLRHHKNKPRGCSRIGDDSCPAIRQLDF